MDIFDLITLYLSLLNLVILIHSRFKNVQHRQNSILIKETGKWMKGTQRILKVHPRYKHIQIAPGLGGLDAGPPAKQGKGGTMTNTTFFSIIFHPFPVVLCCMKSNLRKSKCFLILFKWLACVLMFSHASRSQKCSFFTYQMCQVVLAPACVPPERLPFQSWTFGRQFSLSALLTYRQADLGTLRNTLPGETHYVQYTYLRIISQGKHIIYIIIYICCQTP
jgi:hypothetical protein